ncbi:uncharacterized protein LOC111017008 [Momordica charantia]|uniref:Uncharacterized protein LOC111017008 n=1 Tax=Momordica charantia TaxID=3673 RepID=A0A6J1D3T6_MOMCH|nr:uncharacterized protein LOC111017008 [Momordica charantia]
MRRWSSKATPSDEFRGHVDWELRPGGMIVQKRNAGSGSDPSSSERLIKIKVSHGTSHHLITLDSHSTFGDLKRALREETGLEPGEQRVLVRGKEKEDDESLHMAGLNDMSKVVLMEDPASRDRRLLAAIGAEVDKFSEKVTAVEGGVNGGKTVEEKEVNVLTELLMTQLLKLDAIETHGDSKLQKKTQVVRVQNIVDRLDNLKARISNPVLKQTKTNTAKSEPFKSGIPPTSKFSIGFGSTKITHDWELFLIPGFIKGLQFPSIFLTLFIQLFFPSIGREMESYGMRIGQGGGLFPAMAATGALPPLPPPRFGHSSNHHHQYSTPTAAGSGEKVPPPLLAPTKQDPDKDLSAEAKRLRRVMQSRQYSQKYRLKQLHYISQLESELKALQAEVTITSPRIKFMDRQNSLLRAENYSIKEKLSTYTGELLFKEAQYEELKRERNMLKEIYEAYQLKLLETFKNNNTTAAGSSYQLAAIGQQDDINRKRPDAVALQQLAEIAQKSNPFIMLEN